MDYESMVEEGILNNVSDMKEFENEFDTYNTVPHNQFRTPIRKALKMNIDENYDNQILTSYNEIDHDNIYTQNVLNNYNEEQNIPQNQVEKQRYMDSGNYTESLIQESYYSNQESKVCIFD